MRRLPALTPALVALLCGVTVMLALPPASPASPEGQITWGVHISLTPTWFDPAEMPGIRHHG